MLKRSDLTREERRIFGLISGKKNQEEWLRQKEAERENNRKVDESDLEIPEEFLEENEDEDWVEEFPEEDGSEEFPEEDGSEEFPEEDGSEEFQEEDPVPTVRIPEGKALGVREIVQDNRNFVVRQDEEHNCILLEGLFDGTLSFSKVFPAVYRGVDTCVHKIAVAKREHPSMVIKYGLTVFNDQVERIRFRDGYFTEDEEEFLEAVRNITFKGGSADGREKINEAIEEGIRVLEQNSREYANRGLLLFTDSMPEDIFPDFRSIEGCKNRGLRFAVCYLNSNDYAPSFHLTDRDGNDTEDGQNAYASVHEITKLLSRDGMKEMEKLVLDIMNKVSVSM